MTKTARLTLFMASLVLISTALMAGTAPAATPATHHGMEVKGTVTALDEKTKVVTVRDASGKSHQIEWTAATSVTGGTLKQNEEVTVRFMSKGGKNVAASIAIAQALPGAGSHKPAAR